MPRAPFRPRGWRPGRVRRAWSRRCREPPASSASRVCSLSSPALSGMTLAMASRARSAAWLAVSLDLDQRGDQRRAGFAGQAVGFVAGGSDGGAELGQPLFGLADAKIDRGHQRGKAILLRIDIGSAGFDPVGGLDRGVAHLIDMRPRRLGGGKQPGRAGLGFAKGRRHLALQGPGQADRRPREAAGCAVPARRCCCPARQSRWTAIPVPTGGGASAVWTWLARSSPERARSRNRSSSAARPESRSAISRCEARSCSAIRLLGRQAPRRHWPAARQAVRTRRYPRGRCRPGFAPPAPKRRRPAYRFRHGFPSSASADRASSASTIDPVSVPRFGNAQRRGRSRAFDMREVGEQPLRRLMDDRVGLLRLGRPAG